MILTGKLLALIFVVLIMILEIVFTLMFLSEGSDKVIPMALLTIGAIIIVIGVSKEVRKEQNKIVYSENNGYQVMLNGTEIENIKAVPWGYEVTFDDEKRIMEFTSDPAGDFLAKTLFILIVSPILIFFCIKAVEKIEAWNKRTK